MDNQEDNKSKSSKAAGGFARAQVLSVKEREKIAREAANMRWAAHSGTKAINQGELAITGSEPLPCAVLADGTRVISQMGVNKALNRPEGGSKEMARDGSRKLPRFFELKALEPFIDADLAARASDPIIYYGKGGKTNGVPATLLPEICNVWLKARDARVLKGSQIETAKKADILMRGFAHVGIIALVDEATGYQDVRDRQALQKILDKYIRDEWAQWTKTFPDEYYKQLFRLHGMNYPLTTKGKPGYIGHWTNDIVYDRLAPGVRNKLKEVNPILPSGNRARKHHQHLTPDYGQPELKKHLENVIFLMKASSNWGDFKRMLDKASPKFGSTIPLNI